MEFSLSKRSLERLALIHPDLRKTVQLAILHSHVDFGVSEGLRTLERQKQLFKSGATTTLQSRHLTGHAVDLVAYVDGEVRWDWPLYHKIADAMKAAADGLNIPIKWGGDWKSFPDGPHFQLRWRDYPA